MTPETLSEQTALVEEDGAIRIRDAVPTVADLIGNAVFRSLGDRSIDPAAAALIPDHIAERHGVIGIGFENDELVVAMPTPNDVVALDDIRIATGHRVRPTLATPTEIEEAARRVGHVGDNIGGLLASAEDDLDEDGDFSEDLSEEGPIVRLVNALIARGIASNASDIHIEPNERDVRIRYRIDGVLQDAMRVRRTLLRGIVSRIKIMSELDIADRRMPQDGRAKVTVGRDTVDLRIATLPTLFGEKCVIRVLQRARVSLDLKSLGFTPDASSRVHGILKRPQGMVLVTGPTGSGKTTTLYALLSALNSEDRHIVTVEDPVEYRIPGAYQIQVQRKAGLTFPGALRAILRSDPDIMLVGEIRDRETAQLAVDAALTGHLVLSSMHTNSAAAALVRLTEMGIEPFLVASSVNCVVNQRLVRVLCDRCRQPSAPTEAMPEGYAMSWPERLDASQLMSARGCALCARTGYAGRTVVHEVMPVTSEIGRLTTARASTEQIDATAREQGMRGLFEEGLRRVLAGTTTLEELLRVVGPPNLQSFARTEESEEERQARELLAEMF